MLTVTPVTLKVDRIFNVFRSVEPHNWRLVLTPFLQYDAKSYL